MTVPKIRPAMRVIDMETQKASCASVPHPAPWSPQPESPASRATGRHRPWHCKGSACCQDGVDLIHEDNGVLGHQPRQAHGTEQGHEAEGCLCRQQHSCDTDECERYRQGDDQHRAQSIEQRHDDDGHEYNRRHHAGYQRELRGERVVVFAVPEHTVTGRQLHGFALVDHGPATVRLWRSRCWVVYTTNIACWRMPQEFPRSTAA